MDVHEDLTRSMPDHAPSDRSFGWVFTAFFALLFIVPLVRGRPLRIWALVASGGILLITLLRPTLLGGANRLWMKLARLLSRIMNPLMIGLLFYAVVAPLGLLLRMLGKDPLSLKPGNRTSYWVVRNPPGPEPDSMPNQF
jgi:hypothetical protein